MTASVRTDPSHRPAPPDGVTGLGAHWETWMVPDPSTPAGAAQR